MPKGPRSQPERDPKGQNWNNLNDKVNNDSIELKPHKIKYIPVAPQW